VLVRHGGRATKCRDAMGPPRTFYFAIGLLKGWMMRHRENLKRLLTKFKLRYGEHDALVKTIQDELDSLNEQTSKSPEESVSGGTPEALKWGPGSRGRV